MRKPVLFLALCILLSSVAAATALNPQETAIIAYSPTDTVQERMNVTSWENDSLQENLTDWHYEPGPNTYVFDAVNVSATKTVEDGEVTQVNVSATLAANNLTELLKDYQACKLDDREPNPCNASKYVDRYNKWYYYKGGNLSNTSQLDALLDSAQKLPFHNLEGNLISRDVDGDVTTGSVTISSTYSFTDTDKARFKIGNQSQSFTVSTQPDWNGGTHNGTSADRDDNSGNLGIGYRNGTSSDNLDLYYRMDLEPSGNGGTVTDYSGNGFDGSAHGGLDTSVPGVWSTGAFNSTDDPDDWYVNATDQSEYSIMTDGSVATVTFWVKPEKERRNYVAFQCNEWFAALEDNNAGDGKLSTGFGTYGDNNFGSVSDTVPVGEWSMVTYVVHADSSNGWIASYRNATLQSNYSTTDTSSDNGDPLTILDRGPLSGCSDKDHGLNGLADEFRLYNKGFTESEIKMLYHWGHDTKFNADYNSTTFDVPSGEAPVNLTVNSSNIDASGNETTATVATSNGERQTVAMDTGESERNYTLSFSNTGGTAWVWYNVTAGRAEKTPIVRDFILYTASTSDTTPPSITVHNPPNSTVSDATPDLEVTADETVDTWTYNVDAGSNSTFTPNITLSELTDGGHNVTVYANDSSGNTGKNTRYFTVEEPPNITNLAATPNPVDTGSTVNVTADITDNGNLDQKRCTLKDADGNIEVNNVSMSSTPSDTFFLEHVPSEEPSNIGQWDATCHANDTEGASSSDTTTFDVNDGGLPNAVNIRNNESGYVPVGSTLNISADIQDDGTGIDYAVLATNDSGTFRNHTKFKYKGQEYDLLNETSGFTKGMTAAGILRMLPTAQSLNTMRTGRGPGTGMM